MGHEVARLEVSGSTRPSVGARLARAAGYAILAGLIGAFIGFLLCGTKPGVEGPLAYLTGGTIGAAVGGAVGGAIKGWLHRSSANRAGASVASG